jgi:hypothetical protein
VLESATNAYRSVKLLKQLTLRGTRRTPGGSRLSQRPKPSYLISYTSSAGYIVSPPGTIALKRRPSELQILELSLRDNSVPLTREPCFRVYAPRRESLPKELTRLIGPTLEAGQDRGGEGRGSGQGEAGAEARVEPGIRQWVEGGAGGK